METRLDAWVRLRIVGVGLEAAWDASNDRTRELSTEALKTLWDADWPIGDVMDGVYLEHVHAELCRRGEGSYCVI